LKLWNSTLKDLPQLECDLVKGIEFYKPITCHVVFKHVGELLLQIFLFFKLIVHYTRYFFSHTNI
jgi:hypothetical protein